MGALRALSSGTSAGLLLAGAIVITPAAGQETPLAPATAAPQASTFTFDSAKYAYLTVQLRSDREGSIFDGNCPRRGGLLGIDFDEIVSGHGEREAKLTIDISLPDASFPKIQLDPLTIQIKPPVLFGTRKCNVSVERFHYTSPLFFTERYRGRNFNVRASLFKRDAGSGPLFANTLQGAVQLINLFSPVPAQSIVKVNEADKMLRRATTSESKVSDGIDFQISPASDGAIYSHDFRLSDSVTGFSGNVVIEVRLRLRDTLFARAGNQWTPAGILQTSFPARATGGSIGDYLMLPEVAGTALTTFRNASTIDQAAAACPTLFAAVDGIGLSARDRALLKWALVRGHPRLNANPAMDHLDCMDNVFNLLPTSANGIGSDNPDELGRRSVRPEVVTRPASPIEISSTVDGSQRLAVFLKSADWPGQGRAAAERLFADTVRFSDTGWPGVLREGEIQMGRFEWPGWRWDQTRPLALRVGCYSWRTETSTDIPAGTMYALGQFNAGADGTPTRNSYLRIQFAPIETVGPGEARITSIALLDNPGDDIVAAVKRRHRGCGEGDEWSPAALR